MVETGTVETVLMSMFMEVVFVRSVVVDRSVELSEVEVPVDRLVVWVGSVVMKIHQKEIILR